MGGRLAYLAIATAALGVGVSTEYPVAALAIFATLLGSLIGFVQFRRKQSAGPQKSATGDAFLRTGRGLLLAALATSGLTILRGPAGFTLSDWIFAAAAVFLILGLLRNRRPIAFTPTAPLIVVGALTLTLGGMISSAASEGLIMSLGILLRILATTVALAWLTGILLRSENDLRRALYAWCGSIAVSSIGALAALMTGWVAPGAIEFVGRYSGFTQHPNDLGAMCAISLPAAAYLVSRQRQSTATRLIGGAIFASIGIGGMLSGSVTFVFAAMLGLTLLAALTGFKMRVVLPMILAPIVALTIISSLSVANVETPFDRFNFLDPSGDTRGETLQSRKIANAEAIDSVRAQPFVGTGFGEGMTSNFHEVHNLLLQSWFEGGIFAALGVLMLLITYAVRAVAGIRGSPRGSTRFELNSALAGSYASFLLFSMVALLAYKRFAWVSPALVSAGYMVTLQSGSAAWAERTGSGAQTPSRRWKSSDRATAKVPLADA